MNGVPASEVTKLLTDWQQGDPAALEQLIPIVYSELRRTARRQLRHERRDHSLQSAALVNEVYLRLIRLKRIRWQNRAHFLGVAAHLMRQILVDHARRRHAAKRGAKECRIALDEARAIPQRHNIDLLKLDDCLTALAQRDPIRSQIVELKFFGGLSIRESAAVLGLSTASVRRGWESAKAYLSRELKRDRRHAR
jgi:RNA polymerase sigma factor (TIGR02999 family)